MSAEMYQPGPSRAPEHEIEREEPGVTPGIEVGPDPDYEPEVDQPGVEPGRPGEPVPDVEPAEPGQPAEQDVPEGSRRAPAQPEPAEGTTRETPAAK